jgi:acetylcholinesterase
MIAFGFLASKEVKDAGVGNLGLHDRACSYRQYGHALDHFTERLALSWIQKYIGAFGGDPTKVMMCAS